MNSSAQPLFLIVIFTFLPEIARARDCQAQTQGVGVGSGSGSRSDRPLPASYAGLLGSARCTTCWDRTREGVRRRVEVRDLLVVEVEADRGQVRRLEGHKEHVVEVPAIDVRRVDRTSRDGTDPKVVYSGLLYECVQRVGDRQRVLNPLRRAVVGDAVGDQWRGCNRQAAS